MKKTNYINYSHVLAKIADIFSVYCGAYIAYWLRFGSSIGIERYQWMALIAALLVVMLFNYLNVYQSWRGAVRVALVARIVRGFAWLSLWVVAYLYISQKSEGFDRGWLLLWLLFAMVLSISIRVVIYRLLRRVRKAGFNTKSVIMIGDSASCRSLVERVRNDTAAGFTIREIHYLDDGKAVENIGIASQAFVYESPHFDSHEIWIALPVTEAKTLQAILSHLDFTAANIRYFPDLQGFRLINHQVSNIAGSYAFDITLSPMQGFPYLLKWLEDKIVGGLMFVLFLPLMVILAVLVRLFDGSPVFFRQDRVSWNGKPFKIIKFRGMTIMDDVQAESWGNEINKPKTRLGNFLRKTNFDELPQLWNVLCGDMSLVGPRPERVEFVEAFKHEIPGYMQKHLVKAGMTGWAQIHGWRGDTDLQKRIDYDLWYIENWSLWLDMRILLQTLYLTIKRPASLPGKNVPTDS